MTWLSVLAYLDPGDPDKGGGLSTIAIVGIAVAAVLVVALVVALIRFLWKRA